MKLRVGSIALLSAAALSAAIVPSASAQDAGIFDCRAAINLAAGSGSTHCIGTIAGTLNGTIDAAVDYNELGCPLTGSATGTVSVNGSLYANLAYQRVGAVAVVVLTGAHTGAAAGLFLVDAGDVGPGLCSDTNVGIHLQGVVAAV